MRYLNPKAWWLFSRIVWRVFDRQETMFGGEIVIRVTWADAWKIAEVIHV
jgi:hypothetical protein